MERQPQRPRPLLLRLPPQQLPPLLLGILLQLALREGSWVQRRLPQRWRPPTPPSRP